MSSISDGFEQRLPAPKQTIIASEHNEAVTIPPSEDAAGTYALYKLLPGVGDLPSIYGVGEQPGTTSDDAPSEEVMLQLGVLNIQQPTLSEEMKREIERETSVAVTPERLHELLHDAVVSNTGEHEYTRLSGSELTTRFITGVIGPDNELHKTVDEPGDWSDLLAVLETLTRINNYPLESADEEGIAYEYHAPINLTPVTDVFKWCESNNVFVQGIDGYRNGVFANKPSMSVVHAFNDVYDDKTTADIADLIGVSEEMVSHQLSASDTWITRAVHTSKKYTADGEASFTDGV